MLLTATNQIQLNVSSAHVKCIDLMSCYRQHGAVLVHVAPDLLRTPGCALMAPLCTSITSCAASWSCRLAVFSLCTGFPQHSELEPSICQLYCYCKYLDCTKIKKLKKKKIQIMDKLYSEKVHLNTLWMSSIAYLPHITSP